MTLLGISPMGANAIPDLAARKAPAAFRCGELVMKLVNEGVSARQIITRTALDKLSQALVEQGLAVWSEAGEGQPARLIVRGRANLLENINAEGDLDLLRHLFEDLETKEGLVQLLDLAEDGQGVRIFIGSENKLFSLSGSSLVVAPYRDQDSRVIGALGVIGPTRLNYARIVPMVDYTAQLVGRLLR